jgi:hypothetical protein
MTAATAWRFARFWSHGQSLTRPVASDTLQEVADLSRRADQDTKAITSHACRHALESRGSRLSVRIRARERPPQQPAKIRLNLSITRHFPDTYRTHVPDGRAADSRCFE